MAIEFQFCRDWVTPSFAGMTKGKGAYQALGSHRWEICRVVPPSRQQRRVSRPWGPRVPRAAPDFALHQWGRGEAAELAFGQPGKGDRRAVLQVPADDLDADRQAAVGPADRRRRRRQAVQRSDAGPYALVAVRHLGA